jgi:hypothetical protein
MTHQIKSSARSCATARLAFLAAFSLVLCWSGCGGREYNWRTVSAVGMTFDSPAELKLDAVASTEPSIQALTRFRTAVGNLNVGVVRITLHPQYKTDLDTRARSHTERSVPGSTNRKVAPIAPVSISGMPGRRISLSDEFNGKTMKEEAIVVVSGQTIWELHVFHTGRRQDVEAAERILRSLSIAM